MMKNYEPVGKPWTSSDYLYAFTTSVFSMPTTIPCDAGVIRSLQSDLALIEGTARESKGLVNADPDTLDELVAELHSYAALFAQAHGVDLDKVKARHEITIRTTRLTQKHAPQGFLSATNLTDAELAVSIMLGVATALSEAAGILRSEEDVRISRFADFTCFYTRCTTGLVSSKAGEASCCCKE